MRRGDCATNSKSSDTKGLAKRQAKFAANRSSRCTRSQMELRTHSGHAPAVFRTTQLRIRGCQRAVGSIGGGFERTRRQKMIYCGQFSIILIGARRFFLRYPRAIDYGNVIELREPMLFDAFLSVSKPTASTGFLERATGIEPVSEAWEASILPLYDARSFL